MMTDIRIRCLYENQFFFWSQSDSYIRFPLYLLRLLFRVTVEFKATLTRVTLLNRNFEKALAKNLTCEAAWSESDLIGSLSPSLCNK